MNVSVEPMLIIEDDPESAAACAAVARDLDLDPDFAITFDEGIAKASAREHALIVLDRMLPGGDGIDAIARLRINGATAPVLVVSALGRASNRVEGLDRGADDYLAKPFDPEELRARMRALIRRRKIQTSDNDLIVFDDLEIRLKARTVHRGARHIALSPKEFELITFFARHEGEVVTRKMLLESVWNLHFDPQTNVVDVHVGRLRRKLEAEGEAPLIHTARGEGYLFAVRPAA
ncbi:MAG: response regulator transcription factor [Flavobacteriaceae bacterium]